MIVISEKKLTQDEIKTYLNRGYRFAYGYEDFTVHKNESVGIILDTMYKSTIDLIERLLYKKHQLTLKYGNETYILNTLDDWKCTEQSKKDILKQVTYKHILYQTYLDKRNEYIENQKELKLKEQYQIIYENFDIELPDDEELDNFIRTFGYLYQLDVDYSNRMSKLQTYYQLKWYLEHDIPYVNEPLSIDIDDEQMFDRSMFKIPSYEEPIEVISFGDQTYLEDFIYKNVDNSCNTL